MKKIAVLTSGGDAAGMNAAIRAVVRNGISDGLEVWGVSHGFRGLIEGRMRVLNRRDVGGIIQHGGTMLGSARCPEFKTEEGRDRAIRELHSRGIEGVVVIGGNGSQTGAASLDAAGFPVVGVASTIDNDLYGSDITIGADTALSVALESIDRLKITASSHNRVSLVEVMGRDCGYIGLMTAIAGGAEAFAIPERPTDVDAIARVISDAYKCGKSHAIVVVAEGADYNATALAAEIKKRNPNVGFDLRVTILGHVQRGGNPGVCDRLLGTRFGAEAADLCAAGKSGVLVGLRDGRICHTPFAEVLAGKKTLDPSLLELADELAR